jgi:predicted DCC family thiol-disulfide oxidoreductase YuxK
MLKNASNLILFDGVCNLCNRFVQFIIKRDSKGVFKFSALQSPASKALLSKAGKSTEQYVSVVYIKGGELLEKSTAVLYIAKDLGGFWSLFYVFLVIPRPIRDWVYNRVARSRYSLFGKRQECMIPTPELESRFLDKL